MANQAVFRVLIILFPGFNTLDVNGASAALSKSGCTDFFTITVAAETEITKSVEGMLMQRHIDLDDDLAENAPASYDVLIVPGGNMEDINVKAADTEGPFLALIDAFAKAPKRSAALPRVLMSVCTGSFFLAGLGIFTGRVCTTHWQVFREFAICIREATVPNEGPQGVILPARFVDAGENKAGVRVISSGGISCGIDASLHLVKTLCGEAEAISVAQLLDYAWRTTEGVVFGETYCDAE